MISMLLECFPHLRVFPHKSCHIAYHEVKLNLQPDHQHDHLIHKWQCVLTGSLNSFHFAGMGDSRCPVTWGPMFYNYKYLVFKRLHYKVKFLAFIIIWFNPLFQQASESDKCSHWRNSGMSSASSCSVFYMTYNIHQEISSWSLYQTALPGTIQFQVSSINMY